MSVTIDTLLTAGNYYIKVHGTGNNNAGSYGSLGAYTVNGHTGILPIHDVSLTGTTDKNKHNLSWRIIADEPIRTIEIQASDDGSNFTTLTNLGSTAINFSYQPYKHNAVYYRLKVTSVIDQTVYSNIVVLRAVAGQDNKFTVSTLVQTDIVVNASENYQYLVSDMNGRMINTGKGLKGINRINIVNQPAGMYIIQLYNNEKKQTERIIKQ